jgi:CBS-domain-containing membrane protein
LLRTVAKNTGETAMKNPVDTVNAENSTLGELIAALTDETSHFVHDEKEVYRVVAYMVADLLNKHRLDSKITH